MIRNYTHVPPEHVERQLAAMPCALTSNDAKPKIRRAEKMSDSELAKAVSSLQDEMRRRGLA